MLFLCCFLSGIVEANQELIMAQGGISLLSMTAADAEDPQTLRMVAGAIANLCGNGMLNLFLCYFLCYVFGHSHHYLVGSICSVIERILRHYINPESHLV